MTINSEQALGTLAGLALADSIPVALRQMNVIKRLPDVPWRGFDANKVTTSPEAYPLGVPDGIPATALYLTELGLLALRRRRLRRGRRSKWLDAALAACVAGGAIAAGYYAAQMAFVEKRACIYCLSAIAINFAMVPFAWRLVRAERR